MVPRGAVALGICCRPVREGRSRSTAVGGGDGTVRGRYTPGATSRKPPPLCPSIFDPPPPQLAPSDICHPGSRGRTRSTAPGAAHSLADRPQGGGKNPNIDSLSIGSPLHRTSTECLLAWYRGPEIVDRLRRRPIGAGRVRSKGYSRRPQLKSTPRAF